MNGTKIIFLLSALVMFGCANQKKTAEAGAAQASKSASKSVGKDSATDLKDAMVCKNGKESRTLRIEGVQPAGCKLWYSSFSKDTPVATSQNGNGHCTEVRDRIKGKLEAAQYQCSAQ